MNKIVRTIEIPAKMDAGLRQRAEASGVEITQVIEDALGRYLEDIDDVAEDERRWAQYERDGKSISGDAVKAWIDSWGKPDELPMPKP